MVIFHSYVSLPEGMARIYVDMCVCVFVQFKENYIDDLDEVNESR